MDLFLLLLTKRFISSRVGGFMSNLTLWTASQTKLLLCSRWIRRLGSEYVSFKCFSRTFFSVLSTPDFGWSNMFFAYLYGSWKKSSCSFVRFTRHFLKFSALLSALCFCLRSCQILSRPSFSSALAKRICFFFFLDFSSSFWDLTSFFDVCYFWLMAHYFSLSPRKFSYRSYW